MKYNDIYNMRSLWFIGTSDEWRGFRGHEEENN